MSFSPSPSDESCGRERGRKREILLFLNHLCYVMVWR